MTDRRSFFARLGGALAGLVAAKSVNLTAQSTTGVDLAKTGFDQGVIRIDNNTIATPDEAKRLAEAILNDLRDHDSFERPW